MPNRGPSTDERTREFVSLLGVHDGRLCAFILTLVPDYADADDLAQQVRLALWEQFDEFDRTKDFGVWARTIAYYKVLAFRKRSARQHARLSQAFLDSIADEAGAHSEAWDDTYRALVACLAQLDAAKRKLLISYYSAKESMRVLAGRLHRTTDSVRHSIQRTRAALAECIANRLREGRRP